MGSIISIRREQITENDVITFFSLLAATDYFKPYHAEARIGSGIITVERVGGYYFAGDGLFTLSDIADTLTQNLRAIQSNPHGGLFEVSLGLKLPMPIKERFKFHLEENEEYVEELTLETTLYARREGEPLSVKPTFSLNISNLGLRESFFPTPTDYRRENRKAREVGREFVSHLEGILPKSPP